MSDVPEASMQPEDKGCKLHAELKDTLTERVRYVLSSMDAK